MQSVPSAGRSVVSVSSTGTVSILGGAAGSPSRTGSAAGDNVLGEIMEAFRGLFSAALPTSGISQGPSLFSSPTPPAQESLGGIRSSLQDVSQKLSNPFSAPPAPANAAPQTDPEWPFPDLGPNPLMSDPTGSGPTGSFGFNPQYFPTQETAETIASMLGGKVVPQNVMLTAPGSHFRQNQPNYMIEMPNGNVLNPGFIAQAISVHQPRAIIDAMIYSDVNNTPVAIGQAPHFVPVNAAGPKSTPAPPSAPASGPGTASTSSTASVDWSSLDQMMTHSERTLGRDAEPSDSAAVEAQQRMQLVLKMLQLVARLAALQQTNQPEMRNRRPVTP